MRIDHRRERLDLPEPVGPVIKMSPLVLLGQPAGDLGAAEIVEREDLARDGAEDGPEPGGLVVSSSRGNRPRPRRNRRSRDRARRRSAGSPRGRDLEEERLHLGRVEGRVAQGDELALGRARAADSRCRGAGRCPSSRAARRRGGRSGPRYAPFFRRARPRARRGPCPPRWARTWMRRARGGRPPVRREHGLPPVGEDGLELVGALRHLERGLERGALPARTSSATRVVQADDPEALPPLLEARYLERLGVADEVPERTEPAQDLGGGDHAPAALARQGAAGRR